jgi:hypothetical protein
MNITELPNDIFLLIVKYLSSSEIILCRSICKQFYAAFTDPDLNRQALLQHYPRAREFRTAVDEKYLHWSNTYAKVEARYSHLNAGKPRVIERLALGKSFVVPKWARHYPVSTWHQHLQFEEKTAPFHYQDTLWTYDGGLLIYPSAELQSYALYDLEAGKHDLVDLDSADSKVVRRIRLKDYVLIVEWCEEDAFHQLNESEMVYRHFATAYDLLRDVRTRTWHFSVRLVSRPRS